MIFSGTECWTIMQLCKRRSALALSFWAKFCFFSPSQLQLQTNGQVLRNLPLRGLKHVSAKCNKTKSIFLNLKQICVYIGQSMEPLQSKEFQQIYKALPISTGSKIADHLSAKKRENYLIKGIFFTFQNLMICRFFSQFW